MLALGQDPAFNPTLVRSVFSARVVRAPKLIRHSTNVSLIVRNIPVTIVFEITAAGERLQVAKKNRKILAQRHIQNSEDSPLGHMQSVALWLEVQAREARISMQKQKMTLLYFL